MEKLYSNFFEDTFTNILMFQQTILTPSLKCIFL